MGKKQKIIFFIPDENLKEHVALDRTSWAIKALETVCYKMHMVRKMFEK